MTTNEDFMATALNEAVKAFGLTTPNPLVGACIVKDGVIIGKGYHQKAGGPHAEVEALANCKTDTNGATAYVTLEPCSTTGRTGPCTDALIKAGIQKVIIGTLDPNPDHAGKAVSILKEKGIEVEHGVLAQQCYSLNLPFNKWITSGKPLVTLKMAMTLDGKIATKNGISQWITGPESREVVQELRKRCQAIMVGGETVKLDNPSLEVKNDSWLNQPQRYIWSSQKEFDKNLKVMQGTQAQIVKPQNKEEWESLLNELGKNNVVNLLLEGGGELAANAIASEIVDEIYFFIAPKFMLGKESRPVTAGLSPENLDKTWNLKEKQLQLYGNDILIKGWLSDIYQLPKLI